MGAAQRTISTLLERLYDRPVALQTAGSLSVLADRFIQSACVPGRTAAPRPLTERDALLITYADQLRHGTESPLQILAQFCMSQLQGVVSGVHLLPFYPWSSDDGFSVKDFFAVEPSYGGWEDIARLGTAFDLMFDGVFNHMSAQSDWFQGFLAEDARFRDFFVTVAGSPDLSQVVRPRALPLLTEFASAGGPKKVWTTFSADQVDLNFKNPQVLLRVAEVLLFYVARGAHFIRLDAVAFLWKEIGSPCLHLPQTHLVIQILRALLDAVAPHVSLITETNVPHADNISYFGNGSNEAQLVYNFALPPLVLHSFVAGNTEQLTRWAQSLELPSERVTFFNFLASHDGIGLNPVRGILSAAQIDDLVRRTIAHGGFISYKAMSDGSVLPYEMNINFLDALSNPARQEAPDLAARKFLTAHAVLLSLQGMPGIYFHSLFGSRGDRAGADASGIARRINRQKLEKDGLEAELSDANSLRARVFAGCRQMLDVRQQHPAFAPTAQQRILVLDPRVFALVRQSDNSAEMVLCLQNVSSEPVALPLATILPGRINWRTLWPCHDGALRGAQGLLEPFGSTWLLAQQPVSC